MGVIVRRNWHLTILIIDLKLSILWILLQSGKTNALKLFRQLNNEKILLFDSRTKI